MQQKHQEGGPPSPTLLSYKEKWLKDGLKKSKRENANGVRKMVLPKMILRKKFYSRRHSIFLQ